MNLFISVFLNASTKILDKEINNNHIKGKADIDMNNIKHTQWPFYYNGQLCENTYTELNFDEGWPNNQKKIIFKIHVILDKKNSIQTIFSKEDQITIDLFFINKDINIDFIDNFVFDICSDPPPIQLKEREDNVDPNNLIVINTEERIFNKQLTAVFDYGQKKIFFIPDKYIYNYNLYKFNIQQELFSLQFKELKDTNKVNQDFNKDTYEDFQKKQINMKDEFVTLVNLLKIFKEQTQQFIDLLNHSQQKKSLQEISQNFETNINKIQLIKNKEIQNFKNQIIENDLYINQSIKKYLNDEEKNKDLLEKFYTQHKLEYPIFEQLLIELENNYINLKEFQGNMNIHDLKLDDQNMEQLKEIYDKQNDDFNKLYEIIFKFKSLDQKLQNLYEEQKQQKKEYQQLKTIWRSFVIHLFDKSKQEQYYKLFIKQTDQFFTDFVQKLQLNRDQLITCCKQGQENFKNLKLQNDNFNQDGIDNLTQFTNNYKNQIVQILEERLNILKNFFFAKPKIVKEKKIENKDEIEEIEDYEKKDEQKQDEQIHPLIKIGIWSCGFVVLFSVIYLVTKKNTTENKDSI